MKVFPNISAERKASIVACALRLWLGTLRYRFVLDDPDVVPRRMSWPGLYAFWHEALLFPLYTHAAWVTPLISRSRDGQTISAVVQRFGGRPIRGSTDHGGVDRGGRRALRQIVRHGQQGHIGVPLDGPVGPRRVVPPGVAVSASLGGLPVIPVGYAADRAKLVGPENRRVSLPAPGCTVWCVAGRAIDVPPGIARADRDAYVSQIQAAMDDVQARAEALARGRRAEAHIYTLAEERSL